MKMTWHWIAGFVEGEGLGDRPRSCLGDEETMNESDMTILHEWCEDL